jgi:hypothetical protein
MVTLFITKLTCTVLEFNLGLQNDKMASNRLRNGIAFVMKHPVRFSNMLHTEFKYIMLPSLLRNLDYRDVMHVSTKNIVTSFTFDKFSGNLEAISIKALGTF